MSGSRNSGTRQRRGSTPEFIAFAERVSGQQLDGLFTTWLFTAGKPAFPPAAPQNRAAQPRPEASERGGTWLPGLKERLRHGHY